MSGEEEDKKDETWCLYDGELIDDEVFWELSRIAADSGAGPLRQLPQRHGDAREGSRNQPVRAIKDDAAVRRDADLS